MTPEQIAEAGQRLARIADERVQGMYVRSVDDQLALALAQLALREWVPREDREQAIEALTEASEIGAGLTMEIADCECEPYRWNYPSMSPSDDYAYDGARLAAQKAATALRLLKLEDTPDV